MEEWLASLHGTDGQTTSVNGIQQEEGNVTLTGADIPVSAEDSRKLSELAQFQDQLAKVITVTEDGLDLGGRYLDNAVFR